jgi:hypothetical protein
VKNAHTSSHLRVINNEFVFICMEECIYVYSLARMVENRAALVNIIQITDMYLLPHEASKTSSESTMRISLPVCFAMPIRRTTQHRSSAKEETPRPTRC